LLYRLLADLVVALHVCFVAFVVAGGFLVLRRPALVWAHVPAAVWGALIEYVGWVCPLTPLENMLRRRGGAAGYTGGFIEHYVLPVLYPMGLTRHVQMVLGTLVVAVNVVVYGVLARRLRRRRVAHAA
jgi:hypothetical protein